MTALILPAQLAELSWISTKLGFDDPVKLLEEISWVDTDRLRRVGAQVWGSDGAKAAAQSALEKHADELERLLLTSVQDRWEGLAYGQLQSLVQLIQASIKEQAGRLNGVGSALTSVADAFEVHWYEAVGYALAAQGLLLGVAGLAVALIGGIVPPLAAVGFVLGVLGLIVSVVGLLVALCGSVLPRIDAATAAISTLDSAAAARTRLDLLRGPDNDPPDLFPFPHDHRSWTPETTDPNT